MSRCTFLVLAVCLLQTSGALGVDDGFAAARQEMIEEIQAIVAETRRETGRAQLAGAALGCGAVLWMLHVAALIGRRGLHCATVKN